MNEELERARAVVRKLESQEMPVCAPEPKQIPAEIKSLGDVLIAQGNYLVDLTRRLLPVCDRPNVPSDGEKLESLTICDVASAIRDLRFMATANTQLVVDILNHLEL